MRKTGCNLTKRIIVIAVCVICAALMVSLFAANVAIGIHPFDNGGCISLALDKSLLMKADKVIIRVGEEEYETTDSNVIHKITSETKVATNTDLRYPNTDRWIDVYCGNLLVRSMRWADNHDTIVVYSSDRLHWVFPSMEGDGIVYPSEELVEMLNEIIGNNHTNRECA